MKRYLYLVLLLALVACEPPPIPKPLALTPMAAQSTGVATSPPTIVVAPFLKNPTPPVLTTPTIESSPRPDTALPETAFGSFAPNPPDDLDVHGRYYTRTGDCRADYCPISLWPDNAAIWVHRETIGLPRYVAPTPRPPPPTPIPYCAQVGDAPPVCGTVDDKDYLDALARQKWLELHPSALPPDETAAPWQCSACP